MLFIYARSVGTGHTLCVSLLSTVFTNLFFFPYQYVGLESTVCGVLANLWYYAFLITTVVRIIVTKSVK